ncbi:hypothetical protein CFV95_013420 [Leptospira interrogans]|uniref:DNA primase small subunit n=1 Tax=Leptospira interrogans TaxID=173 RepID=A0AAV9FWD3_LEPIR|nr:MULTISPECIES: hypothetical protein [Leptospira]AJR14767.1 hypothetical protein LIL_12165 [Leptospira interrogans serovar Linhai str. 56609]EMN65088.1 hypothetical protein LEP1GSC098_4100 [Leptospira interrogans serovar Grippotyphosa str. UI 08434]KAK2619922.1 hypothetical protein CFV95_013420 [Leptospira interrogans]
MSEIGTNNIVKYSKRYISDNYSFFVELLYRLGFDIRKEFEDSEKKRITYFSKEGYKTFFLNNRRNQFFGFISNHFLSRFRIDEGWNAKKISQWDLAEFRKYKNLALSEHPNSDILYIDLDTHNPVYSSLSFTSYVQFIQSLLNEVELNLGCVPVFCEISRVRRGAHIFYRVEDTWDKENIFLLIERVLKATDNRIKLELRKEQGKGYRLPFAWDYLPYSIERKTIVRSIPIALKETLRILDSKLYKINYNTASGVLYQNNTELLSESFISKIEGSGSIWKKERLNKEGESNSFQITEGNRVGGEKTIFKVLNYCLSKGMDYEQTKEFCLSCNSGSKDLTAIANNPNGKEEKDLRTLYEYCKINFKSEYAPSSIGENESKRFHSNLQYLTPIDLQWIDSEAHKTVYIRNKTFENVKLIMKEVVGKFNYDVYVNKRKVSNSIRLKKELKEKLCEGAQFPDEFFHRLKAHYKIKFSVKEFKNKILNQTRIFAPIDNGIKGGFLNLPHIRSCKQYTLTYDNLWIEYFGNQFEKKIL